MSRESRLQPGAKKMRRCDSSINSFHSPLPEIFESETRVLAVVPHPLCVPV